MIKYPSWYFKYYDEIFRRATYSKEIDKVNDIYPLYHKKILEIGSGKGYHAQEIVKYTPKLLFLIDHQKEAIEILEKKFLTFPNIHLTKGDAFNCYLKYKFDIALIFYSVLPQVKTITDLKERIKFIFNNHLNSIGVLVFEYIDYNKSLEIYPERNKNLLVKENNIEVYIRSIYKEDSLQIEYSGFYQGCPLNYKINLLRLDKFIIDKIIKELKIVQIENVGIDNEGRRRLSFLRNNN